MDVSGWLRQRLRERLAPEHDAFSFVIADGIAADLTHEHRALELLEGALDVLLDMPTSSTVLIEIERAVLPGDARLSLRFTGTGSTVEVGRLRRRVAKLAREARRVGGDASIEAVSENGVSVIVTLPAI